MKCAVLASLVLGCTACRSELSDKQLFQMSANAERIGPPALRGTHQGPPVVAGAQGTSRFANKIFVGFDSDAAFAMTTFADRFYREPGNEGFETVIDELVKRLEAAGFGRGERLLLEVIETPMKAPSWTPRSARLSLVEATGQERVLHAFSQSADADRTMLPVNAPSTAKLTGRVVTTLDAVEVGCVLLSDGPLRGPVLMKAKERGAALVIASDLANYNVDPTKQGRELDAIGYRHAPYPSPLPVVQVSPRTATALREAVAKDKTTCVAFECETTFAAKPLRTLVATIVGEEKPDECVAIAAHVQEPGACDNASGIGSTLESALTLAKLIGTGELKTPARSLCFVWGQEITQSQIFLDHTKRRCIAAIAADMTGESFEKTAAFALLERTPDPAAVTILPPDAHTAWLGESRPTAGAKELKPNGLAVIARCAMIDVGAQTNGWKTSENPFEGGSDHVVYLDRGIPSVLLWHFPDFAYHTSLDRLTHVDAEEMHRTGVAITTAALAIADARPADFDRYARSLRGEVDMRLNACAEAKDDATAQLWKDWFTGARLWLRELCFEVPAEPGAPPAKKETQ